MSKSHFEKLWQVVNNQAPRDIKLETPEKKLNKFIQTILKKDGVLDRLSVKYKIDAVRSPFILGKIPMMLLKVGEVFTSVDNLKDKRILDIACGNNDSIDQSSSAGDRIFEPWLCRALRELGAKPVGVDMQNLDHEEFEHYQINLSRPGALNIFPDESFDGIHCAKFFDSPYLRSFLSRDEIEKLRTEVEMQIKRLLKSDGKLIGSYDKEGRVLTRSSDEG